MGFGFYLRWRLRAFGEIAMTGAMMLSGLPFLMGFDLVLQAIISGIQAMPK